MGTPDTYGPNFIQLKTGPCKCKHFNVGDRVFMGSGVYVAREGVVVIVDDKVVATFSCLTDKYGGIIAPESILMDKGVIAVKVKKLVKAHKKPRRQ